MTSFLKTGTYSKHTSKSPSECIQTHSPAMDILVSSNFERLLWYLCRGDTVNTDSSLVPTEKSEAASIEVCKFMNSLKHTGEFTVRDETLLLAREIFMSGAVDNGIHVLD